MPASTPGTPMGDSVPSSATARGCPQPAFPTTPVSASRLYPGEPIYTSGHSPAWNMPDPATFSRGRRIVRSTLSRVDSVMLKADRLWHRYSRATRSTSGASMFKGRSSTSPIPPFVYQAPPRHELRIRQACVLGAIVLCGLIVRELRTSRAPYNATNVYTLPELRVLREQRLLELARASGAGAGGADA